MLLNLLTKFLDILHKGGFQEYKKVFTVDFGIVHFLTAQNTKTWPLAILTPTKKQKSEKAKIHSDKIV